MSEPMEDPRAQKVIARMIGEIATLTAENEHLHRMASVEYEIRKETETELLGLRAENERLRAQVRETQDLLYGPLPAERIRELEARVAALEAEVTQASCERDEANAESAKWQRLHADELFHVAVLEEALQRYGRHDGEPGLDLHDACDAVFRQRDCTCGLRAAHPHRPGGGEMRRRKCVLCGTFTQQIGQQHWCPLCRHYVETKIVRPDVAGQEGEG